ncbi:MAG: FkbM family methyltransferase [Acidobacteria bacterium]|nr:FkbM family methyltransferase [Acidobacteriota bacterium]MDW7983863.1 FkbM family methyltransferase [Acidobacteriota bacterium]
MIIKFTKYLYWRLPATIRPPWPTRLPFGAWWVIYRDPASIAVLDDRWEYAERQFVCQFLQAGMTFIDVGANLGFYTLLASSLVGPKGKIVAFEPVPSVKKRLTLHVILNRCSNVSVEGTALGDIAGERDFFVVTDHTDISSLQPPDSRYNCKKIKVVTTTLDRYIKNNDIQAIGLIKVDVEGAELQVLRGSLGLLSRKPRPVWLIELIDANTLRFGYLAKEVVQFVKQKSFLWFSIDKRGTLRPLREDMESFDNVAERNFVAVPEERLQEVGHLIQVPEWSY